jgi:formylglycine-generating enzyme
MRRFNVASAIVRLAAVLFLFFSALAAQAVTIQTVPVGDPGNIADTPTHSGNPAGQGSVDYTYNIGKYEITATQYCEFLNAVAAKDPYGLYHGQMPSFCGINQSGSSGSFKYSVASGYVNRPVSEVSFWDACRFANWLNNGQPKGAEGPGTTETGAYTLNGYSDAADGRWIQRNPGAKWALPTEDEWYKAAYYKGGSTSAGYWTFPTRSNAIPGRNLNDPNGNNANYYGNPSPIQSPYYTTVVGEFQNSASPYGTVDQGGNVCEWNECTFLFGDPNNTYRGERGGSYGQDCSEQYGQLQTDHRMNTPPYLHSPGLGFRVVELPEPTSLVMLVLAGTGMLAWRFVCRKGRNNGAAA